MKEATKKFMLVAMARWKWRGGASDALGTGQLKPSVEGVLSPS